MFDNPYELKRKSTQPRKILKHNLTIKRQVFVFKAKKRKYVVEIDFLRHHVAAVKFYPKDVQNEFRRYRILTRDLNSIKIFSTLVRVMEHLLTEEPRTSFAFVGVPIINDDGGLESVFETSRFKRYRLIAFTRLGSENFIYLADPRCSAMFIINRFAVTEGGFITEEDMRKYADAVIGYMAEDSGVVPCLSDSSL